MTFISKLVILTGEKVKGKEKLNWLVSGFTFQWFQTRLPLMKLEFLFKSLDTVGL